jgi:hypothetical protein
MQDLFGPSESCPCGSGNPNGTCHGITSLRKMRVIKAPSAGSRTVLLQANDASGPIGAEESDESNGTAQACGTCETVLLVGVDMNQFGDIVFKCRKCGSYNESMH